MITSESLDRLKTAAKKAGCDREQIKRFLKYGYIPQLKNLEFHGLSREADMGDFDQIAYGGTRGQAKTHAVLCQIAMDDCMRQPNLKVLFIRKIQGSAKEQFGDLIRKILKHADFVDFRNNILHFKNGSQILFGGFKDANQIARYIGLEYDVIAAEDVTQVPESYNDGQNVYDMIRGQLRTNKPNWKPRVYLTANPGGVGHGWFKNRFVEPKTKEARTRYVHAKLGDNKFINPEYELYLKSLKGRLGKLWREGSWDVDIDGALWTADGIEATRVVKAPHLSEIIIGVDPSGSEDGDAQGIIVVGLGADGHIYVLADETTKGRVEDRYRTVVRTFHSWEANLVVAESNYGGDQVKYAIKQTEGGKYIPVQLVRASRGKDVRAEPVAMMWDAGQAHIVGELPELEAELTTWVKGDKSPNRLDALVFACMNYVTFGGDLEVIGL